MKKFILCFLLLTLTAQTSFGACEYEKERYEKNESLCRTWGDISGYVAAGGAILGGIFLGPLGGICGGAGLAPGAVTWRVCTLRDEKKRIWEDCERNVVAEAKRQEEVRKDRVATAQAKAVGPVAARIFMRKLADCQQKAQDEIDALTEDYLNRYTVDQLQDPTLIQQMQAEVKAIEKKYF